MPVKLFKLGKRPDRRHRLEAGAGSAQRTRMPKSRATWLILGAVAIAGIVSFIWFRAQVRAGQFTTLAPAFDGACVDRGDIPGAEDMAFDRNAGLVFIASDDRRANAAGQPVRGSVRLLPWDGIARAALQPDATGGVPRDFHPHGIGIHRAADGRVTVMVVNHPRGHLDYSGTRVEIYDLVPGEPMSAGRLVHRRSAQVEGLERINDIVPTGPDSFYATSESDLKAGSLTQLTAFLLDTDRSGSIWHVDGQTGRELQTGLSFANSVALSPDGRALYASATVGRGVLVYDRDTATNNLSPRGGAPLGTGVDNLDVEPDGRVWVAAHPRMFDFVRHASDPKAAAPSQVVILEPAAAGQGGKADQVYLKAAGDGFSGASVALRQGSQMVLGSVFEPGLRICTLPAVWRQSESRPAQRLLDTARDEAGRAAAGANSR